MTEILLYSEAFCDREMKDIWTVRPSSDLFEDWMRQYPTSDRLFIRIQHPNRIDEPFLVAVGDPVHTPEFRKTIFLPNWMIEANQYNGIGETTTVTVFENSALQKATRIVVRPIDSVLFQVSDILAVFEKNLSKLGVLQQGKVYPLPLEELGGMVVSFYTEVLEPEGEVYLDGDDIPLEFEQSVDELSSQGSNSPQEQPGVHIPTPPPPPGPRLEEQGATMIPVMDFENQHTNTNVRPSRRSFAPKGFTAFSGAGHRLNG